MDSIEWRAIYKNGEIFPQHKKDGNANKYGDIDRSRLEYFDLHKGETLLFRLHMEPGRRLIVRRRTVGNLARGRGSRYE